ncbi:MAG: rRNA maturation RNase YbeY [Oscillospiraceae bacterium]|nr:rRNA maturation RNase YbeY [Candidatus Equicaccousia limihippi]
MPKTVIEIENLQDITLPDKTDEYIKKACLAVLKNEGFEQSAEISVSFVTEEQIQTLNRDFRDKDSVTDVLSFPLKGEDYDINPSNGCAMLGDVIICIKRAGEQATEFGHSLLREITFLTVHSVLHLLGYDHIADEDAVFMRPKEKQAMEIIGEINE